LLSDSIGAHIEFGVMSRRVISNLKSLLETGTLIADLRT
jgi:hypothetical protein